MVVIGSIASRRGRPFLQAYSASKFGVVGLCESLAVELARDNITVNCVCPASAPMTAMGQVVTGWKAHAAGTDIDAARAAVASTFPLRRYIDVEDVVGAVLYLLSTQARNVTGVALNVDAGKLLVS